MATRKKKSIPPLSEIQCRICLEILVEPITLPCEHTICNICFQSIVENGNLCCPFCRRQIAAWTRYHTERNTLVNIELWEKIKKHYPRECNLRMAGQTSEETFDDFQPVHVLSEPSEMRKEYEEEVKKMEAERQAIQEEENKASEEYIQKLLAEEEEEERRQAEKRRRDMEEQVKSDEELARKISLEINSALASPENSRKADPVTTKSKKKRKKKKETDTGDIQEYVSPEFQFGPESQSAVQGAKKKSKSKANESSDIRSPRLQEIEIEENITQIGDNTVETANEESHLLTSNEDMAKRKKRKSSFEVVEDPCISSKRGKIVPKSSSDQ